MSDYIQFLAHELNGDLPTDVQKEISHKITSLHTKHKVNQRRVLLIGGSGYIGTTVTTELLKAGYAVRNLDCHVYGNGLAALTSVTNPNYEFFYGDFCEAKTLNSALEGITDVVFLAGLVGDPITKKFPAESKAINDKGVKDAMDFLNGRGLAQVLFISTCSNYGLIKEGELADEEFELNPLSSYASDKVTGEKHLLSQKGNTDYDGTVLRFATAFGMSSRMRFDLTVNEFTRDLYLGKELVVFDAETWRPYCHVKDFAKLIRRVFELDSARSSFEVFNAGGESNNATKQMIVDKIVERIPNANVTYQGKGTDPRNYRVNFQKVQKQLLFQPSQSLDNGINEIIQALQQGYFQEEQTDFGQLGNFKVHY